MNINITKLCDRILLQLLQDKPNLALEFRQKLGLPQISSQSARSSSELLQAAQEETQKAKQKQQQEAEAKRIEELKQFVNQAT